MRKKSKFLFQLSVILLATIGVLRAEVDQTGPINKTYKSYKKGSDAYFMNINNIKMPMNYEGVLADVQMTVNGVTVKGGTYSNTDNKYEFAFSGGFFMTGKTPGREKVWGNGVASASRVQDYIAGTKKYPKTDSKVALYILDKSDPDFGESWRDWKDAVELGAYFYDGDNDGVYDPKDKNGNGKWDPDEDRPDLLGDQTVWCVYNDGVEQAKRRFTAVEPQGIEVRQTVFGFASKGLLGNILFVRYNVVNTGMKADIIDSCLFGAWADPDLGGSSYYSNDLVGCDVPRNAGYVYNDKLMAGEVPLCFYMDFFQGPINYIPGVTFTDVDGDGLYTEGKDTPITNGFDKLGPIDEKYPNKFKQKLYVYENGNLVEKIINVKNTYPGSKNMGIYSFIHYQQSDPQLGDPNYEYELRNYMLGLDKEGKSLDPCTWYLSKANFAGCATTNNKLWYSGDPITGTGWLNNKPTDQRQMTSTGYFRLIKGIPVNIVVAYVVGNGNDNNSAILQARKVDDFAQSIYDKNFKALTPPEKPVIKVESGDNYIDLVWKADNIATYDKQDSAAGIHITSAKFHGFNVYAFLTNSTSEKVNNVDNIKLIKSFYIKNNIGKIFKKDEETQGFKLLYDTAVATRIDKNLLVDPNTSTIRYRITTDPFTGQPLIKGKMYNFAVTSVALNYLNLKSKNIKKSNGRPYIAIETGAPKDDYYFDNVGDSAITSELENQLELFSVECGKDAYTYTKSQYLTTSKVKSISITDVRLDIVDKTQMKNANYTIVFTVDSTATKYDPRWSLIRKLVGSNVVDTLVKKSNKFSYEADYGLTELIDGFIVRVKYVTPKLGTPIFEGKGKWLNEYSAERGTGIFYLGTDIAEGANVSNLVIDGIKAKNSTYAKIGRARNIELRFTKTNSGMAYRYINGVFGTAVNRKTTNIYAGAVTAADTNGTGIAINPTTGTADGYVPVPFTAWVNDETYGEKRQLAVGFVERVKKDGGNPDGVWNPGDSLKKSFEYIIIFDEPYKASGDQKLLTGGEFTLSDGTKKTLWADLSGKWLERKSTTSVPASMPANVVLNDYEKMKLNSVWLSGLYAVGLEFKKGVVESSDNVNIIDGDKITLPIATYPITNSETFTVNTNDKGEFSAEEKRALFEKVNVFPNPLYAYNSNNKGNADEPYVTFSNLPVNEPLTIKIYSLSGALVREIEVPNTTSPFVSWDLKNSDELRVASGMYIAVIHSPNYGDKVLKFAVIMPQKQIPKY
ncbi:MAG TPA: hypothetical protein PK887_08065 [Ignavibacteriales bacterium]|nr:hypothetical protein [Ignavibacteriales bacterium]